VPAGLLYRLPATLSFEQGAYVEPVAASLAVLEAGVLPAQRGLLYGTGRIAELTRRVLEAHGFCDLEHIDPANAHNDARLDVGGFDFAVETRADDASLHALVRALRPGATLVLKSRPASPAALDVREVVRRELRLQGAHYGSFEAAIDLLASGRLEVDDLFGPVHALEDFARVFDELWVSEAHKHFFAPSEAR
jgi:threonine dehydrogenase-like Zn-dependent dehydrogenase